MGHFGGRSHCGRIRASVTSDFELGKPARPQPDPAEIARLAYSYWEARGKQGGSAMEDWLRAEAELRRRSE